MGMGSESAAGGGGGIMGMLGGLLGGGSGGPAWGGGAPMSSDQYGGGASLVGGAAAVAPGDFATSGYQITEDNSGMGAKLMGLLKDPQVVKALGATIGSVGSTMASADKIPPHAKEMIKQAISGAQQKRAQQDALNPYGGDMMRYITPDMARGVLDAHGIPYGRMGIS